MATSGPGAIHLLNGLYDAKMDHQPVVAIVGQAARPRIGRHYQQEVDAAAALQDVARQYVRAGNEPGQNPATRGPGLAHRAAEETVA